MITKNFKNTLYELSAFLSFFVLISAVMLSSFTVKGEISASDISQRLIRLHVIAESDSEEDQNLKLLVRNAVLEKASVLFDSCVDIREAKELCSQNLSVLEKAAQDVIEKNGFEYTAKVTFGEENYPVRLYEDFSLPSGKYLSLKVTIESGNGKNWWCVLYPPLCSAYATRTVVTDRNLLSEYGFTDNEIAILEEGEPQKGKIVLKSYFYEKFFA